MKPVKYIWCIVVAVLCFLLLLGIGAYCLKEWGNPAQYQGGVLVEQEQPEDTDFIEALVQMEAVEAVRADDMHQADKENTAGEMTDDDRALGIPAGEMIDDDRVLGMSAGEKWV